MFETLRDAFFAIGGIVIGWVVRTMVSHSLSKQLEQHKVSLQVDRLEREVKFRKLHDIVAEVVSESFLRLSRFNGEVEQLLMIYDISGVSKEKRFDHVDTVYCEWRQYFFDSSLFFSSEMHNRIANLACQLYTLWKQFEREYKKDMAGNGTNDTEDYWVKGGKILSEKTRPAFNAIRADLRRILGFED